MSNHVERDYTSMSMKEMVESVVEDSKKQGTVTLPLRTEGYHQSSNLLYTDRA